MKSQSTGKSSAVGASEVTPAHEGSVPNRHVCKRRRCGKRRRCNDDVPADDRVRAPGSHLPQNLKVEDEHLGAVTGNDVVRPDDVNVRFRPFRRRGDGYDAHAVTGVLDKPAEQ